MNRKTKTITLPKISNIKIIALPLVSVDTKARIIIPHLKYKKKRGGKHRKRSSKT